MQYRAKLIKLVTFLGGIYYFLEFVLPASIAGVKIDQYHEQISNGFVAVGAAAIGLGLINLLMVHGSRIIFRRRGWFESCALLLGLTAMAYATAGEWAGSVDSSAQAGRLMMLREFSDRIMADAAANKADVLPVSKRNQFLYDAATKEIPELRALVTRLSNMAGEDVETARAQRLSPRVLAATDALVSGLEDLPRGEAAVGDVGKNSEISQRLADASVLSREGETLLFEQTRTKRFYEFLYQSFFISLGAAMFSLLGFYIAAAAYRAFRIRSSESALMLCAALLVMLGQIPFGLWIWDGFPEVRVWLLSIPSSGAFRAIKIGALVAGLVMAFRMWLSIESESFAERS
ncbi:MAG: hypothetical protein K1X79_03585 [Oligoflexia bacterium]|nr:hypothetical protein [Oligoflexia bacterium]